MNFVVVGLSHKTASLSVREQLAVPAEKIPEILARFLSNEEIQEAMLISTCNRVEAYLVTKHLQSGGEIARTIFSEMVKGTDLSSCLYVRNSEEAIAHLFRVTAGLDSLVIGEPQISGQVKEAYAASVAAGATGSYLNKLVHKALQGSKKVRTETGIGRHPVSISYAAVLLSEKIFGDLSQTKVLILGAGEMASLAAKHLIERKVEEIWVSNRTDSRAEELGKQLGATSVPWSDVLSRLDQADILIASTSASDYILKESDIREAMRRRKNRPMFLVDIAVPRNIDPAVNQIENVYLYDVDHLKGLVESNLKEREKEAKRAEGMIAQEVQLFLDYLSERELSPTIRELSKKFDFIRSRELAKYLSRLSKLSPEEKEAVEACTRAIVNKILHEPIILMKTEEAKEGGPKYSEILRKLFKLEEES
jgi:glutamyl-tRNA reductase